MIFNKFFAILSISFLTLVVTGGSAQAANKFAYLFGGSDNPEQQSSFTYYFNKMRSSLDNRGWQTQTLCGDGRALPNSKAANLTNLNQMLAAAQNAKAGDEVILFYQGHGAPITYNQDTHNVGLENDEQYNMDLLKNSIKPLLAKGVKVALVDLSCYSGRTQDLADQLPGLCVVSAAPNNYLVNNSTRLDNETFFSKQFVNIDTAGLLSIEEHYLKTRIQDTHNLPQISSLPTPTLDFFDYWSKTFDPDSYLRLSRLRHPYSDCPVCNTKDWATPMKKAYGEAMAVFEKANNQDFSALNFQISTATDIFFQTYSKLENLVAGINALVVGPTEKPPRFGDASIDLLMDQYRVIAKQLYTDADQLRSLEHRYYQKFTTGTEVFDPLKPPQNRKNDACASFQL
jgi:hypothetical protein